MNPVKIVYPLLLLALALPATASAQTPAPDDRAAAQAMADAAARALADFKRNGDRSADELRRRGCNPLARLPERRSEDGFALVLGLVVRKTAPALAPRMRELRTELANIQTADPALIAGRAAWRRFGRAIDAVAPFRGDLCDAIRRWRRAGYPRADVRRAEDVFRRYAPTRGMLRRTREASRRMVALGVPRADAKAFDLSS